MRVGKEASAACWTVRHSRGVVREGVACVLEVRLASSAETMMVDYAPIRKKEQHGTQIK